MTNTLNRRNHYLNRPLLKWLLVAVVALSAVSWFLNRQIQAALVEHAVLRAEFVSEDVFQEMLATAPDSVGLLWRLWRTGKVPQRLLVVSHLRTTASRTGSVDPRLQPLLIEAAVDPDMDAREQAIAALDAQKSPRVLDLARQQLKDLDPQARLLGLQYVRRNKDRRLVPEIMALLRDPDRMVVASAEALLRTWTGNDFGIRIRSALAGLDETAATSPEPAEPQVLRDGLAKWADWWRTNESTYDVVKPVGAPAVPSAVTAGNFGLYDLEGHLVHLTDYRGKVVFINFWATWCNACVTEIPDLIGLQKRLAGQAVILAVCLDGRSEEDHEHDGEGSIRTAELDGEKIGLVNIRKQVQRLVQSKGINYPVLLDTNGEIGARFNGHELPTNVIIDANGCVRRRFIGTRSVPVLEAMLREAGSGAARP